MHVRLTLGHICEVDVAASIAVWADVPRKVEAGGRGPGLRFGMLSNRLVRAEYFIRRGLQCVAAEGAEHGGQESRLSGRSHLANRHSCLTQHLSLLIRAEPAEHLQMIP